MIRRVYVGELDDLLTPGDYDRPGARRRVRVRIQKDVAGRVELLADCPDANLLDRLVDEIASELGVDTVEATPCG